MNSQLHSVQWHQAGFSELTLNVLYEILKLRQEVFVVEQNAAYLDNDGLDYKAYHFWASLPHSLEVIAYCRLIPAGLKYPEISLGRVVVAPRFRRQQLAQNLVSKALFFQAQVLKNTANRISAQTYLIDWYTTWGFKIVSEQYLEDGLPHVEMLKEF